MSSRSWDKIKAERFRSSMKEAGITQTLLAEKAGVSPAFVNKVVHGKRPPSDKIENAVVALGMGSIDQLVVERSQRGDSAPPDWFPPASWRLPPDSLAADGQDPMELFQGRARPMVDADELVDRLRDGVDLMRDLASHVEGFRARAAPNDDLERAAEEVRRADPSGGLAAQAVAVLRALVVTHHSRQSPEDGSTKG